MFIVFEIQMSEGDTISTLTTTHSNQNEAENKYHTVLAAAAVSTLPCHACVLMDNEGNVLRNESYRHPVA